MNLECTACKQRYDAVTATALGEIGLAHVEGAEPFDEARLALMFGNLGNADCDKGEDTCTPREPEHCL